MNVVEIIKCIGIQQNHPSCSGVVCIIKFVVYAHLFCLSRHITALCVPLYVTFLHKGITHWNTITHIYYSIVSRMLYINILHELQIAFITFLWCFQSGTYLYMYYHWNICMTLHLGNTNCLQMTDISYQINTWLISVYHIKLKTHFIQCICLSYRLCSLYIRTYYQVAQMHRMRLPHLYRCDKHKQSYSNCTFCGVTFFEWSQRDTSTIVVSTFPT